MSHVISVRFTERPSLSSYETMTKLIVELDSGLVLRVSTKDIRWHLLATPCCGGSFSNTRDNAPRRSCKTCDKPVPSGLTSGKVGPSPEALFGHIVPLSAAVITSELTDRLHTILAIDYEREPEAWRAALRSASGPLL